MAENKCKSLDNLLPSAFVGMQSKQAPENVEVYRHELHREMAKQWPIRIHRSGSTSTPVTTPKSTIHSNIHDKMNSIRLSEKKNKKKIQNRLLPMDSDVSVNGSQPDAGWYSKAREGIISYSLPDGLPDSSALYNKLQELMKTDTIHLNDRRFWTKLENQFKKLRKHHLEESIEHLRQNQEKHEQNLVSKGILPYTTEEAIKLHAKQQQTALKTNSNVTHHPPRKNCLLANLSSNEISGAKSELKTDELGAFESDNVHPCFNEISANYQFQSKSGRELAEKFSSDLHQAQMQIKTIFPKTTRRDSIRQELSTVRTSEGLYTYSNRLPRRTSK